MIDIILKISGTVIVLNIILTVAVDGKYERYISLTAGLIILLVMVGSFKNTEILLPVFNESQVYENNFEDAFSQKTAFLIEEKLKERFPEIKKVSVDFDTEIKNVWVEFSDSCDKNEKKREVSEFLDVKESIVTAE